MPTHGHVSSVLVWLLALLLCACQPLRQPGAPVADDAVPPAASGPLDAGTVGPTSDTNPADPIAASDGSLPADPPGSGASLPPRPDPSVWELLQQGLDPAACAQPQVQRWLGRYRGKPERFSARLSEFAPLLDYVVREVVQRELPLRFALVPMVESSFYGVPARGAGPAGLWQLMPATARELGLSVRSGHDDRLDHPRATQAALNYLQRLLGQFDGDVELALAAYNAGDGRVRRALRRGPGRDPRDLPLPRITHEYLDKLEALSCLFDDPEAYEWSPPPLPQASRLEIVLLPFAADAVALAEALRLPEQDFRRYNGAIHGPRARAAGHAWLVPSHRVLEVARLDPAQVAPAAAMLQTATGEVHVVRRGDNLWSLARRYGLSVEQLRQWNQLRHDAVLAIGQRLRLSP